jgi:hypothetical protein
MTDTLKTAKGLIQQTIGGNRQPSEHISDPISLGMKLFREHFAKIAVSPRCGISV